MVEVAVGAYARAGTAARRAAALIAVLRPEHPAERVDPALVLRTLRDHHEPEPIVLTDADVAGLRSVAAALRAVLGAPDAPRAAEQLNVILVGAPGSPRLSYEPAAGWRMDPGAGDPGAGAPVGRSPWVEWFATGSALAFARLMVDRQVKPGGLCAAAGCGTPFADLGRGDPRRYCSPRCATRERVAAHRRRQAADAR